jgi:ATP:dephospho-CoA triphosphoribosyl transferase
MAIMSSLVDTCLLHRGGWRALHIAKQGARTVLEHGGTGTSDGMEALMRLEALLLDVHASPGGSADLLAGTLFLDSLARSHLGFPGTNGESPEAAAYIELFALNLRPHRKSGRLGDATYIRQPDNTMASTSPTPLNVLSIVNQAVPEKI